MSEISIISNPSDLLFEDLIDEYEKLSQFHRKLKENSEKCEQEHFQLRRDLELAAKRETYLSQEIDSLIESHEKELFDAKQKTDSEINDLRARLTEAKYLNREQESEIDRLKGELVASQTESKRKESCDCGTSKNESKSRMEYLEKMEKERMYMLHEIENLKDQLTESAQCLARNDTELQNMIDCFECSEENIRAKNQELDEKNCTIDSLHEKIIELNTELAELKSGNSEPGKKGNSLFAEVDDQRQYMKQILAQQKQQYSKMKRDHQEGQLKIRRLQRENADMHREVQQCSQMLQNADHYYKKSLNNTIGYLESEVCNFREKLRLSESRLIKLAREHNVTWLESMLDYCKEETKSLKDQLYVTRIQKCEAEAFYVESQEQAARWRFEALKSRCIIVDRETLLEQNNIPFGPLAEIGNKVEKLYLDGSNEIPNITHDVPLTSLPALPVTTNKIADNESTSDIVFGPVSLEKDISIANARQQILSKTITESDSVMYMKSVQGDDSNMPHDCSNTSEMNKENQIEFPESPGQANAQAIPRFQPINITAERMKVLSHSIINNNEEKTNSEMTKKKVAVNRPKVAVRHIVFKRE